MIIGTIPASSAASITLTYVPEYLFFTASLGPNQLRVTALGDGVICDLDGNGISALNGIDQVSRVPNGFLLRLSDGIIKGKNVEITMSNAMATPLTVMAFSERQGVEYVQSLRQAILANSGVEFRDFAVLALPSLVDNDTVDVLYRDGTNQRFTRQELNAMQQQASWNNTSHVLENLDGRIKSVNVIAASAQTAYVMRFTPVTNVSTTVTQNTELSKSYN